MRLPLAIPLDARDGLTDQDGRMTNVVAEVYEDKTFVTSRPALNQIDSSTGTASGVVCFGGVLVSLYGTTVYDLDPEDTRFWFQFTGSEGSQVLTNSGTGGTTSNPLNHNVTLLLPDGDDSYALKLYTGSGVTVDDQGSQATTPISNAILEADWTLSFSARFSATGLAVGTGFFYLIWNTMATSQTYNVILNVSRSAPLDTSAVTIGLRYNATTTGSTDLATNTYHDFRFEVRSQVGQWYVNDVATGSTVSVTNGVRTAASTVFFEMDPSIYDVYATNDFGIAVSDYQFVVPEQLTATSGTIAAGQYDFAQSTE